MKRQRLSLLCALLLACTGCLAQTQKTDSVARAEIRKIKLSEDYLYADAMSGNGYAEAGTMAVEELRVQVATLLTEEQRDSLSRCIEGDFAVPVEHQNFVPGEEGTA